MNLNDHVTITVVLIVDHMQKSAIKPVKKKKGGNNTPQLTLSIFSNYSFANEQVYIILVKLQEYLPPNNSRIIMTASDSIFFLLLLENT